MCEILQKHNQNHNKYKKKRNEMNHTHNYRRKNLCPLEAQCLTNNFIYQASVKCNNGPDMIYVGSIERSRKEIYNNHKSSFANKGYANNTMLSKYIKEYKAKWRGA